MSHIALQRQLSVGGIAGVLGRVSVVFALRSAGSIGFSWDGLFAAWTPANLPPSFPLSAF